MGKTNRIIELRVCLAGMLRLLTGPPSPVLDNQAIVKQVVDRFEVGPSCPAHVSYGPENKTLVSEKKKSARDKEQTKQKSGN